MVFYHGPKLTATFNQWHVRYLVLLGLGHFLCGAQLLLPLVANESAPQAWSTTATGFIGTLAPFEVQKDAKRIFDLRVILLWKRVTLSKTRELLM